MGLHLPAGFKFGGTSELRNARLRPSRPQSAAVRDLPQASWATSESESESLPVAGWLGDINAAAGSSCSSHLRLGDKPESARTRPALSVALPLAVAAGPGRAHHLPSPQAQGPLRLLLARPGRQQGTFGGIWLGSESESEDAH